MEQEEGDFFKAGRQDLITEPPPRRKRRFFSNKGKEFIESVEIQRARAQPLQLEAGAGALLHGGAPEARNDEDATERSVELRTSRKEGGVFRSSVGGGQCSLFISLVVQVLVQFLVQRAHRGRTPGSVFAVGTKDGECEISEKNVPSVSHGSVEVETEIDDRDRGPLILLEIFVNDRHKVAFLRNKQQVRSHASGQSADGVRVDTTPTQVILGTIMQLRFGITMKEIFEITDA